MPNLYDAFRGTGVALVTPFHADRQIDFDSLERLINHVIDGGVEYVVSLGTTGESATLSESEKHQILDFTVKTVAGRIPVVAGFGGNNTEAVVTAINSYHFEGIDAILSVSPYYNKPTQEGIYRHYLALDAISPRPIIMYNVPGRTGSNILAETSLRIAADAQHVFAIKEASGDLVQCMELVKNKPDEFLVLSGDDNLTLPMLSFGMDGVISVIANAFARPYAEMVRLGLEESFTEARSIQFKLLPMMDLLFREGNPGGIKAALKALDLCEEHMRLPLYPISDDLREAIREESMKIQE